MGEACGEEKPCQTIVCILKMAPAHFYTRSCAFPHFILLLAGNAEGPGAPPSLCFVFILTGCLSHIFLLDYKLLERKWIVLFLTFSVVATGANASVD